MNIRRWVAGALTAGFVALPAGAVGAAPTSAASPPTSVRLQGMTEAGYSPDVFDTYAVTGAIQRLKADGVNCLAIQVAWYQQDNTSTVIAPSPTQTPTDASVTQLIALAHQNGMRVFLNPFVNSDVGSGWEGVFHPSDVAAWFQSYDAYLAHYARLAQADHADLLGIGDEFDTLDTNPAYTPYWDQAIGVARTYYTGPITYGADYTNYQNVTFWNKLDEVGIDAYFPLSQSTDPTVAELVASWNQKADQIQAWRVSSGLSSKPFLITELGYPSEDSAASNPGAWEPRQPVNTALQQKLYEATFQSIWQRPWLAGIMWFWWANPSNPNWLGGPDDNGYTIRNKPAETTLKDYFTAAAPTGTGSSAGSSSTPSSSGSSAGRSSSGGTTAGGGSTPTTTPSGSGSTPILVGLAPGQSGSAIYTLQADLELLGFAEVSMSGLYDAATQWAVHAFETWQGLSTAGATTMAFRNAVIAQLGGTSPRPILVGLAPGESGSAVYTLQADLELLGYSGVSTTGVYDAATQAAVSTFETSVGLPVSGTTTMAFRDALLAQLRG